MKQLIKITSATATLAVVVALGTANAAEAAKDRTQYDCRETVKVRTVFSKGKARKIYFVKQCPHTEQMAAGQCETSWLWGMRCKS